MMRSQPDKPAFQFLIHARYNPEQLTVLNIVPGLMCIVLMMSTLFMTRHRLPRRDAPSADRTRLRPPLRLHHLR
jgi:ABC-2 type transport system permease protein